MKNKCDLIEYRGDNFIGSSMVKEYKKEFVKRGHEIIWIDNYSTIDSYSLLNFLIQKEITHIIIFLSPNDINILNRFKII